MPKEKGRSGYYVNDSKSHQETRSVRMEAPHIQELPQVTNQCDQSYLCTIFQAESTLKMVQIVNFLKGPLKLKGRNFPNLMLSPQYTDNIQKWLEQTPP